MSPRPVPRLVRAIVAVAALLVAALGPTVAIATAWRLAHAKPSAAWTIAALPRHHAVAVPAARRRAPRGGPKQLPLHVPPTVAARLVDPLRAHREDIADRARRTDADVATAHRTRAPPIG